MRISDWSSDVCSSDLDMTIKHVRVSRRTLLVVLIVCVLAAGQMAVTGFAGPDQIGNQLKIATFLGLFGISQAIVMIAGGQGLDLSVGAVATLGGIVGAAVLDEIGRASCRERVGQDV